MSDYTGWGLGDTLEGILSQKRAEARQSMLDDLNRQNVLSTIQNRDENTRSLAEQRAAKAADLQSIANQKRLSSILPGDISGNQGDIDFLKGNYPSSLSQTGGATLPSKSIVGVSGDIGDPNMGELTPGASAPPTSVPSKPDASVPTTSTFLGTPAYQEKKQVRDRLSDLMDSPDFDQMDSLHKVLAVSQADPSSDPAHTMEQLLVSRASNPPQVKDEYVLGPDGKLTKAPENAHITRGFQPPRPPNTPVKNTYVGVDSQGRGLVMDAEGNIRVSPILNSDKTPADDSVMHPKPVAGKGVAGASLNILGNSDLFKKFQTAFRTKNDQQARETRVAYINSIADPNVKKDVQDILGDPQLYGMSWEDLTKPNPQTGKPILSGDPTLLEKVHAEVSNLRGSF